MKDNRGHRKRRNHDQVEKKTNIKVTIEKHDSEENKKNEIKNMNKGSRRESRRRYDRR